MRDLEPIFSVSDDPLAAAIQNCLERTISLMPHPKTLDMGGDLGRGSAGLAVAYAHLHLWQQARGFRQIALDHLENAINTLERTNMGPGLFNGITGIAWAYWHINTILSEPLDATCSDFISNILTRHVIDNEYYPTELINGLTGIAIYGLSRFTTHTGKHLLETSLAGIFRNTRYWDAGGPWLTPPEYLPLHHLKHAPSGYFNLGLAHGAPGVIALLGQACSLGVGGIETQTLLKQALEWLMKQRNPHGSNSSFGFWIPRDESSSQRIERKNVTNRISWCYGDLGAGLGILQGALGAGDSKFIAEALSICHLAAKRPIDQTGVVDACFCHGSVGNAHVFHRLYRATGEPNFRMACRAALSQTLSLESSQGQDTGFRTWMPKNVDDMNNWQFEPGLLNGLAGICLVLSNCLSELEPTWDQIFLTNIPTWN